MIRRHVLTVLALLTAPGAAWLIGPWFVRLEARRLWREGRRRAAVDFALGASVAPVFVGFALFNLPRLWPYVLASSAFHLWALCRQREVAAAALMPWARQPEPTRGAEAQPTVAAVAATAGIQAPPAHPQPDAAAPGEPCAA